MNNQDGELIETLREQVRQVREQNRLLRESLRRSRSWYDRFFDAVSAVLDRVFPGFKTRGLVAIDTALTTWATTYPDQAAALAAEYPIAATAVPVILGALTWASYEAGRRRPPKVPPPIPVDDAAETRKVPNLSGGNDHA